MEEPPEAAQEAPGEESAERAAPSGESSGRRLFLGGLPWPATKEILLEHFGKYGEVEEAVVIMERGTNRPRGFGFVTFKEEAKARAVTEEEHIIMGRKVDVKKSVPQESKPRSKKVFVGGLAAGTTTEALTEYFGQFGDVADAQIMLDHQSKRSRGFGFITFADEAGATTVMAQGPRHMVSGKEVEVKQATPRGAVQQPPAVPAGPGPGPSGGGMLYPPRPGFAGAFGGPAGHPGAYGAVGPYAPHMQYQAGPGYGMPGYGQAAFPAYSGLMLPHPGAYGYQHGYPYGHGYGAPQHLGGAGGYEQQAAQAAAQLPLQAMQAQGPPQYGLPGSSRQLAHPRPPGEGSQG